LRRFISENPLLTRGMSLTAIVVASSTLEDGAIIALIMAALIVWNVVVSALARRLVTGQRAFVFYAVTAALGYIPLGYYALQLFPMQIERIGIYLPLLVVSSVLIVKAPEALRGARWFNDLRIVFDLIFGFGAVSIIIGALREWLAAGTIGGFAFLPIFHIPGASFPYMGFVLCGLLAAGAKALESYLWRRRMSQWKNTYRGL
jgi:electron transport complex protein RnfE